MKEIAALTDIPVECMQARVRKEVSTARMYVPES
jgi:hypothetical protein